MIDYKRVLLALMRGANRRRKLALDEGEIIGWATNESGEHYPIHAAQGGGGGSSGASSSGGKSASSTGGSGKTSKSASGGNENRASRRLVKGEENKNKEKTWEQIKEDIRRKDEDVERYLSEYKAREKAEKDKERAKENRRMEKSVKQSKKQWAEEAKKADTSQLKQALEHEKKWTKPSFYLGRDVLAKARVEVYENELKRRGDL